MSLIWEIRWKSQNVALRGVIDSRTSAINRFVLEAGGGRTEILPNKPRDFVPLPEGEVPWPRLVEVHPPFQWGDAVVVNGMRLRWLAWGDAGKGIVGPLCVSVSTGKGGWALLIRPVYRVTREELESLVIPMTAVAFKEGDEGIRPASITSDVLQALFAQAAGMAAGRIPLYLDLPVPRQNKERRWEI